MKERENIEKDTYWNRLSKNWWNSNGITKYAS